MSNLRFFFGGIYWQKVQDGDLVFSSITGEPLLRGSTIIKSETFFGFIEHNKTPHEENSSDGCIIDIHGVADVKLWRISPERVLSFTKKYDKKDWWIEYRLTQKEGSTWEGTWQAYKKDSPENASLDQGPTIFFLMPISGGVI